MPRRKAVTLKVDPAILARLDELMRESEQTDREVEQLLHELRCFFQSLRSRLAS